MKILKLLKNFIYKIWYKIYLFFMLKKCQFVKPDNSSIYHITELPTDRLGYFAYLCGEYLKLPPEKYPSTVIVSDPLSKKEAKMMAIELSENKDKICHICLDNLFNGESKIIRE